MCQETLSIACTATSSTSPFHHEIEGTKDKHRSKRELGISHSRPDLHVNLLCLLLMSLLNCLALTVDAKTHHVNLHIFSTLPWIPAVMLPFVHSFTSPPVFHRIAQCNQRHRSYDSILEMRGPPGNDYFRQMETQGQGAADDSSAENREQQTSVQSQTSDYFRQMETQGQEVADDSSAPSREQQTLVGYQTSDYFRQMETQGQEVADDSSAQNREQQTSVGYQTSDYFRQMETQGQEVAGPENTKDSNKWNVSPPTFNITPPSLSLPDMPSLPNFFNDKKKEVDENERLSEQETSVQYQTSDYFRKIERQEVAGPENTKDSNKWNVSPPTFNITPPSLSLPDMPSLPNFFNDKKKEVDENERLSGPLNLFGVLPQLEFEFNAQFDPLKKKDAPGGETEKARPSLLDTLSSSINQVTGNGKYQVGDLTRYVDRYIDINARLYVRNVQKNVRNVQKNVRGTQTEIEDLAQRLDQRMNEKIQQINLTRIETQQTVQTVTRTLIRKVAADEYDLSEITFLCKVLFALGVDFSAVAGLLPAGILLELFGIGIAAGIAERFFTAIIKELDRRLTIYEEQDKEQNKDLDLDLDLDPVMSNTVMSSSRQEETSLEAYTPGDLTKQAMQEYTGSESYQVGSISEKMVSSVNDEVGDPIDVISELEECLAMERELAQKLSYIRSR